MLKTIKQRLIPDPVERTIAQYEPLLRAIRKKESELAEMPDQQLSEYSTQITKKARSGTDLDDLLAEAFALVSEAAFRKVEMRPYDVQIVAAIVLHKGRVIEMGTGEGKTLTATMPAFLNALTGKGVHVHTFNDYLAKRDALWMGPVYEMLGLSVGFIQEDMSVDQRQIAYQKDITYLTAKEGGFDFLRGFLACRPDDLVVSNYNFAIIDEVDSLLIDEARIPLVIAGEVDESDTIDLNELAKVTKQLIKGEDFETDEYQLNIFLTGNGISKIETTLDCDNLHDEKNENLLTRINQALQAEFLLQKNVDYIVRNGSIEIVDEFTGRVVDNRKWPHGLQAAIEAKEGLEILRKE